MNSDKNGDDKKAAELGADTQQPVAAAEEGEQGGQSENSDPISETVRRLPEPVRERMTEMFGIMSAGPMPNPVMKKITSEHIGRMIDVQESRDKRWHVSRREGRLFTLIYVIIGVFVLSGFAYLTIPSRPEFFQEILELVLTLALGFLGGWGYAKYRK